MTEPKNTWLADAEGNRALVETSAVDHWKPLGWSAVPEPTYTSPDVMVWLKHEVTGGRARFAEAVVPTWQALGWHPSEPPTPVDLTKDPQLTDQTEEPVASDATPKKSTTKAASGGSNKES